MELALTLEAACRDERAESEEGSEESEQGERCERAVSSFPLPLSSISLTTRLLLLFSFIEELV